MPEAPIGLHGMGRPVLAGHGGAHETEPGFLRLVWSPASGRFPSPVYATSISPLLSLLSPACSCEGGGEAEFCDHFYR